jgi:epsilon-lactone hydrolase
LAAPVAVVGNSADAGLAFATTLSLRQIRTAMLAALVLFSPWADLTVSSLDDAAAPSEVMLSTAGLAACARHYHTGRDAKTPLVSLLFTDLHGLPSVLMQASHGELLYSDAERLHAVLEKAASPSPTN